MNDNLPAEVVARVTEACTDPAFEAVVDTARAITMGHLLTMGRCGEMTDAVVTLACGIAVATTVNAPPEIAARLNAMGPLGAALQQAWNEAP